ncbi:MAG: PEP-CTERM sorting domain-containing protein [Sedimentisphaerales bacterium]|nr:PEP-CTERM sorting domain-containing protein [Sedimentisphaerales bacterium]
MKVNYPANVGLRSVFLAAVIVVSCTFSSAYCQSQKITLLVQQTPSDGGQVTPNEGTYKYDQNSEVTITAAPNKGYEFLYWLGDVSDQESISTTVRLDKPKIVIAVFEPAKSALDVPERDIPNVGGGGGSGGGLGGNRVTIGNSVSLSGGGGGVKPQPQTPIYIPIPAGGQPPAVPEPTTGLLLAIGSLFTFTKRRKKTS